MKKEKAIITVKIVILYSLLMGMTALPLLINFVTQSDTGRLAGRMLMYILMAVITILFCKNKKNILSDFGYSSKSIGRQLLSGGIILLITTGIFVILPLLSGVNKEFVLMAKETDITYIVLKIIFYMLFVGPIEEFIFRGYFQHQTGELISNKIVVCIVTSLLFGFWHYPSTLSFYNVICTFIIGLIYSIFKTKLKNCSMLSVSLAHGLHDTIIFILSCVLL